MYMNILKIVINFFGALFEVYLILFLFSLLLEQRAYKRVVKYIIYSVSILLLVFSGQMRDGSSFAPVLAFLAVFVLINIYNTKFITKLILTLIVFSIFLISEIMTGMLLIYTAHVSIEDTRNNMFIYMCAVVLSKFIVYLITQLIKEKVAMNKLQKPKFAYYILVMPLSSAFAIYLLFLLTYDVKGGLVLIVELAVTLLVLSNIATLYIIDRLLEYESNKEKLQFMQKQFQVQEGHYRELEQRQYEINEFYHNIKNYLLAVEGYINNGEYEKAKERIKQANDTINYESYNTIKTGNTGLDALINAKVIRMQKSNIEFDYNVKIPNMLSIDYIDLCIIIGNALDNAIEACENISAGPRRISLTCIQTGNYISIVISNTIANNIPDLESNDYITTKANKKLHGFGLRSIKHIAEKNKGNVIIEQDNNEFKIKIILYNELV